MVLINEWLPNPTGSDTPGEWVELWNNGPTPVDVSGWKLATGSGKGYVLNGIRMASGEFLVLHRSTTHLTLRNTDGSLTLTDAQGVVVDHPSFVGVAAEGMSANHNASGRAMFAKPTPGAANVRPTQALIGNTWPTVGQVRPPALGTESILLGASCGIALAVAALFIIKRNHGLSELFFSAH